MTAQLQVNSHTAGRTCTTACSRCDQAVSQGRTSPCLPLTNLASPEQVKFLVDLATERELNLTPDAMRTRAAQLTQTAASQWIKKALTMPRKAQAETTQVPEGRYAVAVPGDKNDVSFFKVDHGKGQWTGRVFVKQYASDTEYTLSQLRTRTVLALIAADVEGAARRYGQLIEKCCRCGRKLTDDVSRANGIGPECSKKGW